MEKKLLDGKEVKIIGLALTAFIEDQEEMSKNPMIPFTPDARLMMKDMLDTAKSALNKISSITGLDVSMEPYKEGDEDEFLTKES